MTIWESCLRIGAYMTCAAVLVYAIRHPRAPEGIDPDYWRRVLRQRARKARRLLRIKQ